jgi:hypothetical protein
MKTFEQFLEAKNLEAIAKQAKVDISPYDKDQLRMGIEVEKEHSGEKGKDVAVVHKDSDLLKIAVAHLREDPKYYTKLKKMEGED